jgi:AraC family transcriptional regulator
LSEEVLVSEIRTIEQPGSIMVGVRRSVNVNELPAFFAEVYPKVASWLAAHSVTPISQPMAMWWGMDMSEGIADCQAGFFVSEAVEGDSEITLGRIPAGPRLTITNVGPYSTVGQSWQLVYARAAELGQKAGAGWEVYVDDPTTVPEEELRTEIYLPVA